MSKADCLLCRAGRTHSFHDDGTLNKGYAWEGTEPPSQASSMSAWSQDEMTEFVKTPSDEKPQDLVHQAVDLVYGDRQGAYGHPYDDYNRTASMWSAFLGQEITASQAALMMVLLKLSREMNRPKDDNIVDAHGYLLCYGRILAKEQAA